MATRIPATRSRLIARIVKAAGSIQARASVSTSAYLRTFFRLLAEEDLAGRDSAWLTTDAAPLARWGQTLEDLRTGGNDFATLSVGAEALRKLV